MEPQEAASMLRGAGSREKSSLAPRVQMAATALPPQLTQVPLGRAGGQRLVERAELSGDTVRAVVALLKI